MSQDFQEFCNTFVRLVSECNRPADIWKQEFNWKFPIDIQNALLFGYGEDTIDFITFVRIIKKIVENSQRLQKFKQKDKGKDREGKDKNSSLFFFNSSNKVRGSLLLISGVKGSGGSRRPPNILKDKAYKLLEENTYFVYK